jgi:hypothetical protein
MELKEAFHKWANGGTTLVAYGPKDEGGYWRSRKTVRPRNRSRWKRLAASLGQSWGSTD